MRAARLARDFSIAFPDGPEAMRLMIRQLVDYSAAALDESTLVDCAIAVHAAHRALKEFRADAAVSNVLIADIVVVALGRRVGTRGAQFDESTLRRRYLKPARRRARTPAFAEWQRGWNVLREVAVQATTTAAPAVPGHLGAFHDAIRQRLQPSARR